VFFFKIEKVVTCYVFCRVSYVFSNYGLWNNSVSSVKQSDKKIQNGRQNPRRLPISSF